jgi:acyl carrier protein
MAPTVESPAIATEPFTASAMPVARDDDPSVREILKRCSASTGEAVCRFRRTRDCRLLAVIVPGLLERYVAPDLRARLREPVDELRLSEDLGIDSLTLMEFAMFAEDVFQVSIDNRELAQLRTLGDIRRLVERRLPGLSPPPAAKRFNLAPFDSAQGL